jgi:hypothetical protein
VPSWTICTTFLIFSLIVSSFCVLDLRKPLKLASRKQQNIVKCRIERVHICDALIGSPRPLNSEFAFYTHSKHYPNITTHFRILFHIFAVYFTSLQLIRTSEAYFRNVGPISDLRRLFRKLCTSKTCIPTFGYLRTIHLDHTHLP